ncbi:MAG: hypothetical protein ACQCN5_06010 [Candidatus Bathyarchaeia archaeon]
MKTVKGSISKVPGVSKFKGWVSNRRQKSKEKEKLESAQETMQLKLLTFVFTLAAMGLGLSFIPLFPQPLPLLIAVLVAFVSFKSPRVGIPVGTTLIGLGLIYHLSELTFISYIGEVHNRVIFTVVWLVLFVLPPIIFHRHKTAIAIDLGIIAAMILFYAPLYYLAIPIILTSAVFLKKNAATTILYYVLIALPLQVVQYFKYILTIPQEEWWIVPGSSPPVMIPLNDLFSGLQSSMTQFRLFDTAQFINVVYSQLFVEFPHVLGKTMKAAFVQYIDSFPGIFLFIIIIAGIVLAFVFFAKLFIQEANLPYGEQLLGPVTAIVTTALFFILLDVLQKPLAFSADVDAGTILIATCATAAFTLPLSLVVSKPKITATGEMIIAKANELKAELKQFKTNLDTVKESIPVNVSSPEGRMLIIDDKLTEILNKSVSAFFAEEDLDRMYTDLSKNTSQEIKNLTVELDTILAEYQIFVNGEYSDWYGKLKQAGLETGSKLNISPQKEMTLEQRIASIQGVLIASRNMANDVINTAEPIYNIIRTLYDPELPEECQVAAFAREKMHNKAPFHAISGLYSGLMNWRKQYGQQVEASIVQLNKSLSAIIELGKSSESLPIIFGDKLPVILGDVKRAEAIKKESEKTQPNVLNMITLRELLESFIEISKDVLSVLYEEIKAKEQTIEDLTPAEDTFWEKNATLRERMTTALQELFSPKAELNQVMEHLPKYLAYIDEAVQTLVAYNDRKELLLNYPMAEAAILEQLKIKTKLTPQDLPFQQKYAQEYLRLFYMQRFSQYSFDQQNAWLIKKD